VERPAGPPKEAAAVAEQPSESHHRLVEFHASDVPPARVVLASCQDLLDHRQIRYAVRALNTDGHHPIHQLLPANFRLGELYRHEGATGQPWSIGWTRPERIHRLFGSRLARQIVRQVAYDAEYGFELPCKMDLPEATPVIRPYGYSKMPERMLPDHPGQMTLFISAKKEVSFGVAAAWKERNGWRPKAVPLGKYLTESDAALFAISMVTDDLLLVLLRTDHQRAEIVTKSRLALTEIQRTRQWALPIITDMKRRAKWVEEEGGRVVYTWLSGDSDCEGYKLASNAAEQAARQQPREMRSASLSYVKQALKEKWKPVTKMNKHIENAKKSVAARSLQLESGHAVVGVHLLRIDRVQDARCWWCGHSRQTVVHLMLKCRKWRRERDAMLRSLSANKLTISSRRDRTDLEVLFMEGAIAALLRFIGSTEVGNKLTDETNRYDL
jgi:hypothetical protein